MWSNSTSGCAVTCSEADPSLVLLYCAPRASAPMVTATMAAAIDKTARCVLRANGSANRMGSSLLEPAFWLAICNGSRIRRHHGCANLSALLDHLDRNRLVRK